MVKKNANKSKVTKKPLKDQKSTNKKKAAEENKKLKVTSTVKTPADIDLFNKYVVTPFGAKLSKIQGETGSTRHDGKPDESDQHMYKLVCKNGKSNKVTFLQSNVTVKYEGGLLQVNTHRPVPAKRQALFLKNTNYHHASGMRPIDVSDRHCPDVAIVFTHSRDEKSVGCFLFPKAELLDQDYLSKDYKGGKIAFRVWPSWAPEDGMKESTKKKREWMAKYWVDLKLNGKKKCDTACLKKNQAVNDVFS